MFRKPNIRDAISQIAITRKFLKENIFVVSEEVRVHHYKMKAIIDNPPHGIYIDQTDFLEDARHYYEMSSQLIAKSKSLERWNFGEFTVVINLLAMPLGRRFAEAVKLRDPELAFAGVEKYIKNHINLKKETYANDRKLTKFFMLLVPLVTLYLKCNAEDSSQDNRIYLLAGVLLAYFALDLHKINILAEHDQKTIREVEKFKNEFFKHKPVQLRVHDPVTPHLLRGPV